MPPKGIIDFQTLSSDAATMRRAVTPQVIALVVLAVALALGICLAVGQTLGRRAAVIVEEDLALAALGMTPAERRLVDWMRLAVVTGSGVAVAVTTAVLLSPLMPLGVARDAEPAVRLLFDAVALLAGAGSLAVLLVVITAVLTLRARSAGERVARPSQAVAWLRARASSPSVALGVGLALEAGARSHGGADAVDAPECRGRHGRDHRVAHVRVESRPSVGVAP